MSPRDWPTPAGWCHSETRFCFCNNLASFLASLFPCWTVYELSQCYLHPAHSLIRGSQRHKRSIFFPPFSAAALQSWIVVFSLWRKGARRGQRHYLALIKADKPGWPLSCWVRGWGGGLCVLMTHCPQALLSNHRKGVFSERRFLVCHLFKNAWHLPVFENPNQFELNRPLLSL